jgi:hypothetical protein
MRARAWWASTPQVSHDPSETAETERSLAPSWRCFIESSAVVKDGDRMPRVIRPQRGVIWPA